MSAPSANPSTESTHGTWAWSFFAPAALGLLPAILLAYSPAEKNEVYEWTQHRLAGAGFAAAFALAFVLGRWRESRVAALAGTATLLALGLVIGSERPVGFQPEFVAAGALVAAGYWFCRRGAATAVAESFGVGLGSVLCFWSVSALWWWRSFWLALHPWPNTALFLGVTAVLAGLLVEVSRGPAASRSTWLNRAIDAMVLLALGGALLRSNHLDPRLLHHWSVYMVPADMVREGGALLGDVPSQYGFLNTLILAAWPADNRFTAFFWLHNILVWISGIVIYCSLKAWLPRWWWQLVAGLATVCSVAFLSGDASMLSGPMPFPSGAAMRFIWVYALLGYLMWACGGPARRDPRTVLWTGSGLWLLGVLWSIESALYVTATWFPAASLLAMPAAVESLGRPARVRALGAGIGRALVPAGTLLAGALLVITACYRLGWERWPDFPAYWEYAAAFSGGFFSLPMDPQGGVWTLLLLHCALLGAVVSLEPDRDRGSLALVWAGWGALWTVSTYYVARSHSNTIAGLSPVLLLITSAWVLAWLRSDRRNLAAPWIWLVVPPVVGGMIWLVLPNRTAWQHQLQDYTLEASPARLLPPPAPELTELVAQCQQRQPGPYSIIGRSSDEVVIAEILITHADWLPLRSIPLLMPLPGERRVRYLDRYAHRRGSGWLVLPLNMNRQDFVWLLEYIDVRFDARITLVHAGWRAIYYCPKEGPASVPRP